MKVQVAAEKAQEGPYSKTHNPEVPGSIPGPTTNKNKGLSKAPVRRLSRQVAHR